MTSTAAPDGTNEQQLREMNDALLVSSVRQHEMTEQAEQAASALRRSEAHLANELARMTRVQALSVKIAQADGAGLLRDILAAAAELTGTDKGNIQFLIPATGKLRIVVHQGLGKRLIEHFAEHGWVATCDAALEQVQRVIVEDVTKAPGVAGTVELEIVLEDGIRAIQSTPLISRDGRFLGMLNNHFRHVHRPSDSDLRYLDLLARMAADLIDRNEADNALRESEALRRFSNQAAGAGAWRWDKATGEVAWSGECYELFGIDPQTPLLYESWRNALHPADRERADAAAQQAMERCENLNVEYRINHPQRGERWLTSIGGFIDPVNRPGYMTGITLDITERKQTEERHALLARELQHRTKNLLSVIQSIAQRSLAGGRTLDDARKAFMARLHALADATDLLSAADWQGASINDVVERALETFAGRYSLEGEHVLLSPGATQSLALIVHELCTNATKYGAYSTPDGRVAIRWSIADVANEPKLAFRWQERGGPRVIPPTHTSFGTTLLQLSIGGAETPPDIDYPPEGFAYTFEAPLAAVAAFRN